MAKRVRSEVNYEGSIPSMVAKRVRLEVNHDGSIPSMVAKRVRLEVNHEGSIPSMVAKRVRLEVNHEGSIPSMVDGLKPCQRTILFCALREFNFKRKTNVALFTGYVYTESARVYDENFIVKNILGMGKDFAATNNLNLLSVYGEDCNRIVGVRANVILMFTTLSPIARHLFHEADELIPNFLNEDGKPTWYIPIIPMVLVNGCVERETFVPNYNPRDIIDNIKRLLKGKEMKPMVPWYKGFKGTIKETSSSEYTTTGAVKEKEGLPGVIITQLPIGMSAKQYKKFLEAAKLPGKAGKDEEPFIMKYIFYGDFTSVIFEVRMSETQLSKAKQEGLLKKFKLTTTLTTSNMHLLDENSVIKKYDTPEQILQDFYKFRLEFYGKRKAVLYDELKKVVSILENKVKYVGEVLEGKLTLSHGVEKLCEDMKAKHFEPSPTESEPIGTVVSPDELNRLQNELDKKKAEMCELFNTTSSSLWMKDLDALLKRLDEGQY